MNACLLFALTLLPAFPQQEVAPLAKNPLIETRPIAAEFLDTLEKSEKTLESLKSFSVKARLVSKLTSTGAGKDQDLVSTSTQTLTMIRPDKALIEADWAQFGEPDERPYLRALLDGRKLTTVFVPMNLFSIHTGQKADERLSQDSIITSTLNGSGLDVLLRPEMTRFVISHTDEAKFLGEETTGGVICRKFEAFFAGHQVVMWIGPEDKPLMRKLSETREIEATGETRLTSTRTSTLDWKTAEEIPAETFRLEVPGNAREVTNILETISSEASRTAVGSQLPEIALTTMKGDGRKTSEWKGRAMTIVFWASWMNAPETVLKAVAKMRSESKSPDDIVLVNVGENPAKIRAILDAIPGLPECLIDPEEDLTLGIRIKGIPSFVRIDTEGKVVELNTGLPAKP